jgi:hypothetical protein
MAACSGRNSVIADGGGAGGGGGVGTGAAVLERGKNPSRDAHFIDPGLTKANAARMVLDTSFMATFTGTVWAQPLYVPAGAGAGKGVFIVVTTGNDVLALDETTGATVWTKNVGTPAAQSGAGCGRIMPIGIVATPVIDAQSRTIYLSAAVGAQAIELQEVHALAVDDGQERPGWPVNVSGTLAFDPRPHNPRSALSLVGGIVYVAYGGHVGDCGAYRGRVVAIDSRDPTKVAGWATGGQGEGIWAPGGMASDGNGVLAITGNRTGGGGAHQDSEEVVRVTGMAAVDRATGVFFPASWQAMDTADADFGAQNPIFADVPGAVPAKVVVAIAKDGHMYLLDPKNLGGMGGQIVDFPIASDRMAIHTVPTAYTNDNGLHVALSIGSTAICPPGGASGRVVLSVLIGGGGTPQPRIAWCAPLVGDGAPITTTTNGKSDGMVWYISGGSLRGVDAETGQSIYQGTDSCGTFQKWTSPIAARGRIIAGANGRLCAWSPAP